MPPERSADRGSLPAGRQARLALADSLPIVLGYLPMGAAYGMVARQGGIGLLPAVLMSLLVFAGASQFIAVGLLAGGATALEVIVATFLVNLRHVLMSASLSPFYRSAPRASLPFVAWGITDETFALSSGRLAGGGLDHRYGLVLHYAAFAAWVSGTAVGAAAGATAPPSLRGSLEFVLYAMFAGLLVLQVTDRRRLAVAAASAALCWALSPHLGGTWPVVLASLAGATLGLAMEGRGRGRPSD